MTLIVSLRIPDGIVIAGDSLSTVTAHGQLEGEVNFVCPSCNQSHSIPHKIPIPPMTATTLSYTQKVFPFGEKLAVGTFGENILSGKSIYFVMRMLEKHLSDKSKITTVTETAKIIAEEVHKLVEVDFESQQTFLRDLQEQETVLGFQVAGYDEDTNPKTVEILLGKDVKCNVIDELGCTVSGKQEVSVALWGVEVNDPRSKPPFHLFSLQDAIDYAEFLIKTTSEHQRFSTSTPTVGGAVDIALLTPFDGFEWIRRKSLRKVVKGV